MENGSPKFGMIDCYKVLKYLPKSRVDRQEPCNFNTKSIFTNRQKLVFPTIAQDFNGTDEVQIYVAFNGCDIDLSKITLTFSTLRNGNAKLLSLKPKDTDVDRDNETILSFKLDNNATARDKSRKLTGVESIVLDMGEEVSGVEIFNIVLRSVDYTYTLSDLITSCHNGYDFVLRRLNNMSNEKQEKKEIPELLQQYVYMAAGAYAWLTRWEYEAKPMKEPKSESNNYADRLFAQVDDAITKYLSNIENNRNEEYICMDLFYVSKAKW